MGEQEDWVQVVGLNGLSPDEPTDSIFQVLDEKKWMIAEERAAELIACIKPTEVSEQRRLAVADYVRKLIMQCFPCQVFTFGSVPLKTYLPDGDIDLTTFSWTLDSNDSWANDVRNMLESEEKNENAEFQIQEVQFIQAEVKIVKCLVENIVVDISFNQIGGLCTLCFLEEVDQIIGHNHLFKRSIILIKAWCYYESRILGAHHGLISTYALETLVLYIFHVFNETFKGPLEVLYRFLEFFSKFDWEIFCVSLWGPVPLDSLPEVIAGPPRKDSKQLLLKNAFLERCLLAYGYNPYQEQNGTHFPKKSFNVVDPLRLNNNLGRSVSKGNFFRIRSAFAFGAMKLARLFDCPEENLYSEVNQFFSNTWQRHGNRIRPDAPCKIPKCMRPSSPDSSKCTVEERQGSNSVETQNASYVHHDHNNARKSHARQGSSGTSSRNHSSPEVADVASEPASRLKPTDKKNSNIGITRCNSMNRNAVVSEVEGHLNTGLPSDRRASSCSALDYAADSEVSSSSYQNSYLDDHTFRHFSKEHFSEDEQEQAKMMTSSMLHGFNGQFHLPLNMPSGQLPFAPSMLPSLTSSHKNVEVMFQGNVPFIENPWAMSMQFPAIPPEMVHYFHGNCMPEMSERMNVGLSPTDGNSLDAENKVWHDPDQNSYERFDLENGTSEVHFGDKQLSITGHNLQGKRESFINNDIDHRYQNNVEIEAEETVNSVTEARNSTLRSRNSGCSAGMVLSIAKERQEMKPAQSDMLSSAYESAEIVTDRASVHPDDDVYGKDGKTIANRNTIVRSELQAIYTHIGQNHRPANVELPLLSGMNLGFDHISGEISTDKPGVPLGFIPAGPPVPFLAWFYNIPNGSGSDEDLRRRDTFDSSLLAHWHILMYARSCQTSQNNLRLGYPSQFAHPPTYGIPPGGSVRLPAANMNPYTPFTGGDAHYIPVASPVTSIPNRPSTDYQPCLEEMPRYRGTGTYLPIPKINAENRRVLGNRRVNYGYDRNDPQSGKAGNWNHNKPRLPGRNRIQNHYEKGGPRIHRCAAGESRNDKSWGASYRRPSSEFTYQSQVDSLHAPASTRSGSTDVAYDTYSMPACSVKGGSQSLGSVPSLMMMYPYGQKVGYSPYPQVLKFGSLGPVELPGKEYSLAKDAT